MRNYFSDKERKEEAGQRQSIEDEDDQHRDRADQHKYGADEARVEYPDAKRHLRAYDGPHHVYHPYHPEIDSKLRLMNSEDLDEDE